MQTIQFEANLKGRTIALPSWVQTKNADKIKAKITLSIPAEESGFTERAFKPFSAESDIISDREELEKRLADSNAAYKYWHDNLDSIEGWTDEDFPPFIDTAGFKFNREEANER
jgi:hypothetical protein